MFKRSADKLIALLNESGLSAERNPEPNTRPRKGTFEVRLASGKVVESLPGMPRPFKKLRALDLEKTAAKVVAAAGGRKVSAAAPVPTEDEDQPPPAKKRTTKKTKTKKKQK